MSLRIKIKKHGDVPIIHLSGDAVGEEVSKVSEKVRDLMQTDAATIVVDCSDLASVDSYGLGMFVFSWKVLDEQKRRLVFLNPSPFVKNLFEGSNLDKVFTIIDSIEAL
jgi:anti-anti-sigma factor